MTLILGMLVFSILLITLVDAVHFPRDGTPEEQAFFHKWRLYPFQTSSVLFYGHFVYLTTGSWLASFCFTGVYVVILLTAAHDQLYWVWRFALRMSKYQPGQFLGDGLYAKRTNLIWLLYSAWKQDRSPLEVWRDPTPLPKYIDTRARFVGWGLATILFIASSVLLP